MCLLGSKSRLVVFCISISKFFVERVLVSFASVDTYIELSLFCLAGTSKVVLQLGLPLALGFLCFLRQELVTDVSSLDLACGGSVGGQVQRSEFSRRGRQTDTHFGIASVKMILSGILNCMIGQIHQHDGLPILSSQPYLRDLPLQLLLQPVLILCLPFLHHNHRPNLFTVFRILDTE